MTREKCPVGTSASEFLPRKLTLPALAAAAQKCRGCSLYCNATQAVFGQGPLGARWMFVGEQPGDQEDRQGLPFVGPAGRLLDESMAEAGIKRSEVYVTNAVKHFKWEPRGKRRIHSKPSWTEIVACRPWLLEEISLVAPRLVVCLGATAAQSLLGRTFRLTQHRQEILPLRDNITVMATVHPSSLLRIPHPDQRHAAKAQFVADLVFAARSANDTGSRKP